MASNKPVIVVVMAE